MTLKVTEVATISYITYCKPFQVEFCIIYTPLDKIAIDTVHHTDPVR